MSVENSSNLISLANGETTGLTSLGEKQREQYHKDLRDEVQLYWLIQLGTITALGALMGTWPKADNSGSVDGSIVKLLVLSVAMILITVAGMYKIVGNYYSFIANYRLQREKLQESVVTPWLMLSQSVIATILGFGLASVFVTINELPFAIVLNVLILAAGGLCGFSLYALAIAKTVGSLTQEVGRSDDCLDLIRKFSLYTLELQNSRTVWWGNVVQDAGQTILSKSEPARKWLRRFAERLHTWAHPTKSR